MINKNKNKHPIEMRRLLFTELCVEARAKACHHFLVLNFQKKNSHIVFTRGIAKNCYIAISKMYPKFQKFKGILKNFPLCIH